MHDAHQKLDDPKVAKVLEALNPELAAGDFDPSMTTIVARELPFYPGISYMDVSDHSAHPPRRVHILYEHKDGQDSPPGITLLDWTNEPIYATNAKAPIALTEDNVREYLRFFFSMVRGRHGRFIVTETVDDILWQEEPPPAARKAVSKMIEPIRLIGMDENNTYHMRACVMFKDSLFKALVKISQKGEVDISEEELIIEDMPVIDDTIGQ